MPNQDQNLIINESIKVLELAPKVFHKIRRLDGISNEIIKKSLDPNANRKAAFKAGEGQGKSGSFFFFSNDKKFIIKTMDDSEYSTFKRLFLEYENLVKNPNDSLLARIYGIYTVKKERITPIRFLLMGSTISLTEGGKNLLYQFDLKGSLINRYVKTKGTHDPGKVLKDINLLELKSKKLLKFREEDVKEIMRMIKRDSNILRNHSIMDYSLLLAIEKNPYRKEHMGTNRIISMEKELDERAIREESKEFMTSNQAQITSIEGRDPSDESPSNDDDSYKLELPWDQIKSSRHMYISKDLAYIYHISIIDYLQDYNFDKKLENLLKKVWRGPKAEISAVSPWRYGRRFKEFMEGEVII